MTKYIIRKMKEAEVQIAMDWAQIEGWNPGLNDAHCFYQADPQGFFIGLLDDEPVAVGSAVIYDNRFAFCGLYIVKKEFRKQGYGLQLTEERLNYVGNRITGIDGVIENVPKYERLGYVPFYKQIRYEMKSCPSFVPSRDIIDLRIIPFDLLANLDRHYFQAPRYNFLQNWIDQENSYALGYFDNQQLIGYGAIRKCFKGYKIGPLFAPSYSVAEALFQGLCAKTNGEPVYLDIPEPNENAQSLVKHYKMTPVFEVIRMYRNGFPDQNLNGVYGITTFELG